MSKSRIYLETTMFSFYHEERNRPGYNILKEQTQRVFELLKIGKYGAYSSSMAVDELLKDPNRAKREKGNLAYSRIWGYITRRD